MARIALFLLPIFTHALAAPVRRASSNAACVAPHTFVSEAQTKLASINVMTDVDSARPLLTAQLMLFNASQFTSALAGLPGANGTPPRNFQVDVLDAIVPVAQHSISQVQVNVNKANSKKTTENMQAAVALISKAIDAAKNINSECLSNTTVAEALPSAASAETAGTAVVNTAAAETVATAVATAVVETAATAAVNTVATAAISINTAATAAVNTAATAF